MNAFQRALLAEWAWAAQAWEGQAGAIRASSGLQVWNPQSYGLHTYEAFAQKHLPTKPGALLLFGLNPGKYGMSQTGIPFTDVTRARLLDIGFELDAPGLAPPDLRPFLKPYRVERSSQSVYAFLDRVYGGVAGWRDVWAVAPCGLLFLEKDGTNVTPADARLRTPEILALRREVAHRAVAALKPRGVVMLGQDVARVLDMPQAVTLDHPVARGPGRRGPAWWAEHAEARLRAAGLLPI